MEEKSREQQLEGWGGQNPPESNKKEDDRRSILKNRGNPGEENHGKEGGEWTAAATELKTVDGQQKKGEQGGGMDNEDGREG